MISPILPSHDADTIALDFGVFVAKRAQRYRTSQAAIIAALMPVIAPSQPGDTSRSHAPAADTPDLPAGVKADGVSLAPSADPLLQLHFSDHPAGGENEVEHETRGPNPPPVASVVPDDARPAEAKTSAEDALSSASGGVQGGLPAHPATPSPSTGTPRTLTDRIRAVHAQHPAWTSRMIADALGAKPASVSTILASVRKQAQPLAEPAPFGGKAELVAHYSAVGKRLRGTS